MPHAPLRGYACLLRSDVVAYSKRSATFGATTGKHFAAILRGHSFTETVLVHTAAIGGLKSSFHCIGVLLLIV